MSVVRFTFIVAALFSFGLSEAHSDSAYVPPRPAFAGIHVGMPEDSAYLIMKRIALRRDTLSADSVILLESDSVRIFGQAAYLQLQILHHKVRTIVINWYSLGGDGYTGLRDVLLSYLERYFGHGIVFTDENPDLPSLGNGRWHERSLPL